MPRAHQRPPHAPPRARVARRGQPGAAIEELPDARFRGQELDGAAQELPVRPPPAAMSGIAAISRLAASRVLGEVVLAA
jgi:hypothetical protein